MCGLNNDKDFSQILLFIVNHMNQGYESSYRSLFLFFIYYFMITDLFSRFASESLATREVTPRKDHTVPAPSNSYLPFSVYTVASLNLLAAAKAKSANAYHQARQYTDVGMSLVKGKGVQRSVIIHCV